MCLITIEKHRRYPSAVLQRGYKIFKERDGVLYSMYKDIDTPRLVGIWIEANHGPYTLPSIDPQENVVRYKNGWHFYATKTAAQVWLKHLNNDVLVSKGAYRFVIREVEYREVLATGFDSLLPRTPTVVAKWIRIRPLDSITVNRPHGPTEGWRDKL